MIELISTFYKTPNRKTHYLLKHPQYIYSHSTDSIILPKDSNSIIHFLGEKKKMNQNGGEDKVENGYDPEDDRNHNHDNGKLKDLGELSVERLFEDQEVPSWRKQLTVRAFVVSFMLSILFCFIVMKLNLTTGIIPSLNVSAGLLGFFFVNTWTKLLRKSGLLKQPFTRQENTVIQTCVVASSGIAFSGMPALRSSLSLVPCFFFFFFSKKKIYITNYLYFFNFFFFIDTCVDLARPLN
jgi:hypothetical protein